MNGPPDSNETRLSEADATRNEKNRLRQALRSRRASLSDEEQVEASRLICERLQSLPELQRARTIHVYWPMLERGEIDLRPLIVELVDAGKNVALPVVTPDAERLPEEPRMTSRRFSGEGALTKNLWGVSEPLQNQSVPPEEIDLVIVPALGVSRSGHRIGYGMGHYDEFLATLEVPTVCAVYDACLVDRLPSEPHDVPLSIIVTEKETLRPE